MALPKAIQAQVDQATEIEQQMAAQASPPAPESKPGATDPEPPSIATPSETPVVSVPPVEPKPADGQWEQKYRTLQGMFSRETQVLRQQLHTVTEQLTALQQQASRPQDPPAKPEPLISEKDVEAFGSDLIDVARRVAREEFGNREQNYLDKIAQLEAQIQRQVGDVQQTQAQTSRELFFSRLGAAIPTWQSLQATDACQQWLASRVPGAAFTWNDVLVDAANNFDSERAIEVFNTFAATQPKPAEPAAAARNRSELSRQVTPSRATSSTPTPSGEKRVYSPADYEAASNQIIRLTKAGKYDDAARIEQELNAALLEGRVRP